MTRDEISVKLNVHPETLSRWVRRGCPGKKVRFVGLRERWDFDIEAVQRWLDGQKGDR